MNTEDINNDFVDNGDGTVTSKKHGLMWSKTDSMNDLKKWVNYQESKDYARELSENKFAGYDDWRLPVRMKCQPCITKLLPIPTNLVRRFISAINLLPAAGFPWLHSR